MSTVSDFEQPFFDLKQQGNAANPKVVPLIVIAWEPRGKGEPPLSVTQLQQMIFGPNNSLAHWFQESSQGRYRIVPHPLHPVIGPFLSTNDWQFYWRTGPFAPPPPGSPHSYVDQGGISYYLDDEGFYSGFVHSYAEAIQMASGQEGVNFADFDLDKNHQLTTDECLVLIVKAQANPDGFRRKVCASQIPCKYLEVDGVTIYEIAEFYGAPPHGSDDLAVALEEVVHLAVNLVDQYPDIVPGYPQGKDRRLDDPGRPGQLSITDAGWRPVHVDPYHKLKWGWLNPQLADRSGQYTLHDAATTGDALILFSPYFGTQEFFILENRWRGSSYDQFRDNVWQEGLALWHCIQDPQLFENWGRRAVHLRRADPRLDASGQVQDHLALFAGNDPARGYDLHDESQPQNLRFRNGMPSRIRIRNISPAGPTMTVDVEVPPKIGEIIGLEGYITMLRLHDHGTGYGPPGHVINEDCVIKLDSEPGAAFGIELSGPNAYAGRKMFEIVRMAFNEHRRVIIEYEAKNATGGRVIRVIKAP